MNRGRRWRRIEGTYRQRDEGKKTRNVEYRRPKNEAMKIFDGENYVGFSIQIYKGRFRKETKCRWKTSRNSNPETPAELSGIREAGFEMAPWDSD